MSEQWLARTTALLGEDALNKLRLSHAVVVGLGGVGSFAFEALVRSGIGNITVIDHDVVDETNINRQLVATHATIGRPKTDVAKAHALDINPKIDINAHQSFLTKDNAKTLIPENTDIIIDAIDSVDAKVELIIYAKENNIPILSAMGTANKTNPLMFRFGDIFETSVDPLAKVMRKRLKDAGVESLNVVYSTEQPIKPVGEVKLGSSAYVPSVCGLTLAGKAVNYLLTGEWS